MADKVKKTPVITPPEEPAQIELFERDEPAIVGPRIFAVLDEEGRPTRFYDKGVWGDKVPKEAVHISEEMRDTAITWPGEVKWDGEKFVRTSPPAPVVNEAALRAQRDALLRASDWVMLEDSPIPPKDRAQWRAYRKQLRELPSTKEWPSSFSWPVKPSPAISE